VLGAKVRSAKRLDGGELQFSDSRTGIHFSMPDRTGARPVFICIKLIWTALHSICPLSMVKKISPLRASLHLVLKMDGAYQGFSIISATRHGILMEIMSRSRLNLIWDRSDQLEVCRSRNARSV
jgi:hypothetical protein